jgi:hypothetical protein
MKEIWKDVVGFEGRYQVSNKGNVKSLHFLGHNKERLMKLSEHHTGYLIVQLGKRPAKNYLVHQLVASAFIIPVEGKKFVNHIDGNKHNNCVENLEWVTAQENITHAIETGLRDPHNVPKRYGKAHYSSKPVLQYDLNGKFIKKWDCQSDVARAFNIKSIGFCIDKPTMTCKGYMWRSYTGEIELQIEPHNSRVSSYEVNQYDMQGRFICTWDCARSAADKLGISFKGISECCYGRQKSSGGYIWKRK